MQIPPSYPSPESASKGTATSSRAFVETIEYSRFVEVCEACRHFRYIGLCYGPPGIGKTLSAVRYSRADQIVPRDRWTSEVSDDLPVDTLLYTTSVINTPSGVRNDINMARERVMGIDPSQPVHSAEWRDDTKSQGSGYGGGFSAEHEFSSGWTPFVRYAIATDTGTSLKEV